MDIFVGITRVRSDGRTFLSCNYITFKGLESRGWFILRSWSRGNVLERCDWDGTKEGSCGLAGRPRVCRSCLVWRRTGDERWEKTPTTNMVSQLPEERRGVSSTRVVVTTRTRSLSKTLEVVTVFRVYRGPPGYLRVGFGPKLRNKANIELYRYVGWRHVIYFFSRETYL